MTDPVIERHERAVEKAQRKLANAEVRADRVRHRVVRPDGNIRTGAATEVAARQVEIDELKKLVDAKQKTLADAKADEPRREKEAKRADKLDAEAEKIAGDVAKARAALEQAEAAHAEKRREADEARRLASKTQRELDLDADRQHAAQHEALRARMGREPTPAEFDAAPASKKEPV